MISFEKERIDFEQTGYFNKIVLDYLNGSEKLKKYFKFIPEVSSFSKAIEERKDFPTDRNLLVSVLEKQYQNLGEAYGVTIPLAVTRNIEALKKAQSFTVTTGHQLNLCAGPLYVIYKLISTIRLSEELNKLFPACKIIPVFWLASEDHDIAEINHVNVSGKNLEWKTDWKGASGRAACEGIPELLRELEPLLGESTGGKKIAEDFRFCYRPERTLSEATRMLYTKWFGDDGLVILDPDEPRLKTKMNAYFDQDLFEHLPEKNVNATIVQLEQDYPIQARPRQINLFYLGNKSRDRITKVGEDFQLADQGTAFSPAGMKEELRNHPEQFSPNVILRPAYQEVILPNLAVMGGPAEIAYWIEYKAMFDAWKIPYPILWLRFSAMIVDRKTQDRMSKFSINSTELFLPVDEWIKRFLSNNHNGEENFHKVRLIIEQAFEQLTIKASELDPSLKASAESERQKIHHSFNNLDQKILRAKKRKHDTEVAQIRKLKDSLFPDGMLQERKQDTINYYARYGERFFEMIKSAVDPFEMKFNILLEKESKD